MGLHVYIYRDVITGDCTNNGVSSRPIRGLCLTNVDGPFDPCDDYPAAKLIKQTFSFGSSVKVVPEEVEEEQTMMGGNYASTSDSRLNEAVRDLLGHDFWFSHGPIAIHDRVETREQQRMYD